MVAPVSQSLAMPMSVTLMPSLLASEIVNVCVSPGVALYANELYASPQTCEPESGQMYYAENAWPLAPAL